MRPGRSDCAVCHREREKARYRREPEKSKAAATEWMRRNAGLRRAYMRAYRDSDRERERAREAYRARSLGRDSLAVEYAAILRSDPCSYCGGAGGTVDHVVPRAAGGTNGWENLTSACQPCNSEKHTRPLLSFMLGQLLAAGGECCVPVLR
jgi:5-methylcytosine-specific restriction endonuclease McrA